MIHKKREIDRMIEKEMEQLKTMKNNKANSKSSLHNDSINHQ